MGKVIVEDTTFTITADMPVVLTPVVIGPLPLVVSSSSNVTAGGKKAALKADMEGQNPIASIPYIKGVYVTPGVLSWDGVLSGAQESAKCTKDGNGVVVDDSPSGTVEYTIVSPAMQPGSPPVPDPGFPGTYPGTWEFVVNPNTVLTTNE